MRKMILPLTAFGLLVLLLSGPSVLAQPAGTISAPVLKWQKAGCLQGIYCDTGWYASPAVADLDGDHTPEVIWTNYDVMAINGEDGTTQWSVSNPGGGRGWSSVVAADLDHNGSLEIVTTHGGGYLSVLDKDGNAYGTFPKHPQSNELRSLAVDDVEGDGDLEILVCATRSDNQWFLYDHDGTVRPGFPVHSPDSNENGYAAGCYNENVGLADLDGDGRDELIGPNDTHYVVGYNDNGTPLRANGMYGQINGQNKVWARVGFHYDQAVDLRGYANCGTEHRPNFADSAPTFADVDNDGTLEIIIVGNTYNCGTDPYTSLYHTPYILRVDRTRWVGAGFDWTDLPIPEPNSAPLSEDYDRIETVMPNPVVADIDGDGYKEILYSSYDGRLHAVWLDKTEHGSFPYAIKQANQNYLRFSSEPLVVDIDNDGQAEIIVTTWTEKESNAGGQLLILSSTGTLLQSVNLPRSSGDWDGAMAAPTFANIDGDADYEIVVGTANTGLVAYDLPNSANARILWGTGRGSYLRNGRGPATIAPPGTATPTRTPSYTPTRTRTGTATASPTPTLTATPCGAPLTPRLQVPKNGTTVSTRAVPLNWKDVRCATRYEVRILRGSPGGKLVDAQSNLTASNYTTRLLRRNKTYYWSVRACSPAGCGVWTAFRHFTVGQSLK